MLPQQILLAQATLSTAIACVLGAASVLAAGTDEAIDFANSVQPIFAVHCYGCHGPQRQESNFRLDLRDRAVVGGDFGESPIVPGKSDLSPLIHYVSGAGGDLVMPPKDEGPPLSEIQIAVLRQWIDAGAKWPDALAGDANAAITTDHWSFQRIADVTPPAVDGDRAYSAIDAFILDKLRSHGLEGSAAAGRVAMIRRLYLDMHGLPPTWQQVQSYVNDASSQAYARLVDEVLASSHYGERWARHWLDVVRFAESTGYEVNRDRENAYHYRDYVIASLNSDKSYRDFVIEQLAGDAVGADVGTGFLVGGPNDLVKSPDVNLTLMQRQDELADYVNTTGTAFLGLTIGCARCHNHKFDPISQQDYYSMQAVFAGVQHGERELQGDAAEKSQQQIRAAEAELAELETRFAKFRAMVPTRVPPRVPPENDLLPAVNARLNIEEFEPIEARAVRLTIHATNGGEPCIDENPEDAFIARLPDDQANRARASFVDLTECRNRIGKLRDHVPKAYIGTFKTPETIHRLFRGDPLAPREEVVPDALMVISSLGLTKESPEQARRLALAKWIASQENPLTARVIVNRVWQYHFGTGLVSTPSDLGKNGTTPSHPELLDWLAWNFMENDWSLKWLHRQILLSQAYRQSSAPRADALAIDADTRLLWRFPPRRLEAEAIRDCVLHVSGALNPQAGGPGFLLFEVNHENVHHYFPIKEFGPNEFRRMIYMTKIRQEQDEVFGVFDCPDGGQVIPDRSRSTTPLQALNLLNSRFMLQQADVLAKRIRELAGADIGKQVDRVFELAFSRQPDTKERQISMALVRAHGLDALCRAIFNANEFLFLS